MRWEIIKKAWSLAAEKFPKAKRLFVDLPPKFRGFGECPVLDLEQPDKPLGKIIYEAKCEDGKPVLSLTVADTTAQVSLPKFGSFTLKPSTTAQSLVAGVPINASDIMKAYPVTQILGHQVGYLIAGHEEGLVKIANSQELDERSIMDWVQQKGFPSDVAPFAEDKLEELGIKIARKKKRKRFENYEKIRVVDPRIMEYNEGARVIMRRRDEELNDWYQVIVDGSSKPIWLHEDQLDRNHVGHIDNISGQPE